MGERKGQNKYYPPDFDWKKHGSLNAYHGTHALRERASKISEGILVIRFEMPYNIWCGGCGAHIAMGVRYNAEKKKVGAYLSTPIHEFRMKCHLCDQYFEIRTDPKNMDYVIMSGARRKEQRWSAEENEQIVCDEKEMVKRMAVDAMFAAEHEKQDKDKAVKLMPTLGELEEFKSDWKDDYRLNSMMRNVLRGEKKALSDKRAQDKKLLDKWNLDINLLPENEKDIKLASLYKFNTVSTEDETDKTKKRKSLESESIFESSKKQAVVLPSSSSSSSSSSGVGEKSSSSKHANMDYLKKQLNRSYQEKKLITTGFSLSKETSSSSSQSKDETNSKKTLVLVKPKSTATDQQSNVNDTSKNSSISGLVSNDYGSDDSDDTN